MKVYVKDRLHSVKDDEPLTWKPGEYVYVESMFEEKITRRIKEDWCLLKVGRMQEYGRIPLRILEDLIANDECYLSGRPSKRVDKMTLSEDAIPVYLIEGRGGFRAVTDRDHRKRDFSAILRGAEGRAERWHDAVIEEYSA